MLQSILLVRELLPPRRLILRAALQNTWAMHKGLVKKPRLADLPARTRAALHWDDARLRRSIFIDESRPLQFYFCPQGSLDDTILVQERAAHVAFVEMCYRIAAVDPLAFVDP